MRANEVMGRIVSIALICSSFLLVGAPGGGGHGGGGGGFGGGSVGGGYRGGYSGSGLGSIHPVVMWLGILAIVALCVFFVWLGERKSVAARIGVHKATTRLTVATVLGGNATEHAQFFERIVKSTDFNDPQARIEALGRVREYLAKATVDKGFAQIVPFATANEAMQSSVALSKQQIQCVDGKRKGDPTGESVCVAGFTTTVTPDLIAGIASASDTENRIAILTPLEQVQLQSMDAFYLFYAPAPEDTLTRSQAENMLRDLHALEFAETL